jgi:hypothetical protein
VIRTQKWRRQFFLNLFHPPFHGCKEKEEEKRGSLKGKNKNKMSLNEDQTGPDSIARFSASRQINPTRYVVLDLMFTPTIKKRISVDGIITGDNKLVFIFNFFNFL